MAETMVEQSARAAYEYFRLNWWTDPTDPWEKLSDAGREHWIASQRAAIAAMREPTEAILVAGVKATISRCFCGQSAHPDCDDMETGWRAMIDAALAEGGEG